tara:strand:- start:1461 stop:2888 length:1428 start_codon:yes stop_codon:yes gene_type:complete
MNFSELEQIMSARGVTSLADIARALDTTPQAVSNWKSRNKVPFHVIPKLESNISHRLKNKTQLNQNYYKYTEGNNTIAVSEILLLLARQIKTIFIVSFSFVFFTFLYIQFIDEEELLYISSAKVLLEQNNSNSGLTGIASQFGVNIASNSMASDLGSLSLLPDLITSRTFANQILKKEFFTKKYGTKLSLLSILTHGNLEANIGEDTLFYRAMISFQQMVSFETEGAFTILKCETFEPNFSKELGEVVIDELEKLNLLYRNRGISDKRDFIIKRISAVELDLENSEDNLKSFRERNQQVNSPSLLLEQERLIRELDIQKGIYLTLKQQLEMNKIEEVQKASIIQVLDYPNLPLDPSNQKNKIKILLISIFIGFSSGILISLIREYIEHSHPNTRRQLRSGKNLVFKKIKTLYTDSRIAGIMSIFLLIGLPFFLSHQSLEPKFFGRYSTQAILINLFYILFLIILLFLYRTNRKIK